MSILNEPRLFISAFAVLWKRLEKERKPEKEVLSKLQTLMMRWDAEYGFIRVNSRPLPATGHSPKKVIEKASSAARTQQKSTPAPIQRPLPMNATAGPSNLRPQQVDTLAEDEAIARRLQQAWDDAGKGSTFAMLDRDDDSPMEENEMSSGEDSPMEEDSEDQLEDASRPKVEESVNEAESRKSKGKGKAKAKFDDDEYVEGAEESEKKRKGKATPKSQPKPKETSGYKTDAEGKPSTHARRQAKTTGIAIDDPCEKCDALEERCEIDAYAGRNGACFRCRLKKIRCSRLLEKTHLRSSRRPISKPVISDSDEEEVESSKPRVPDNAHLPAGGRPARRAAEDAHIKAKILIEAENSIDKDGRRIEKNEQRKGRPATKKSRRRPKDDLAERVEEVVKGECRILRV